MDLDPPLLPPLSTADVPRATYRVQFHAAQRFTDMAAAVPYLARLGISHLYASPYLKARKGSTHGYDVVDHSLLNPEVGTQEDYDLLCAALREHGMSQLLDIVPNHMGVLEADNAWWLDVMEHGRESEYAQRFDIDWHSPVPGLGGKVLVGLLGEQYGVELEDGRLKVVFDPSSAGFSVCYFEHRLPLDPACTVAILQTLPLPEEAVASQREPLRKLLDGFAALALPASPPSPGLVPVTMPQQPKPRSGQALALRQGLTEWVRATPWGQDWIERSLTALNGTVGDPASFDRLDGLLRAQHWRIAHWRTTGHELNYRRFFDINTLAALRTEREDVFEATHRTVLNWLAEGRIAGLRIDHPDGLSDPASYLKRLQERHLSPQASAGHEPPKALYVVVEKILADGEPLPADWLAHGDTGYRFANEVNGVFVDTEAAAAFDHLYQGFVQASVDYDDTLHDAKHTVMGTSLAADLERLADALHSFARSHRRTLDFTRSALRDALAELAASFPVYRTYLGSGTHGGRDPAAARPPSREDEGYIRLAERTTQRYALSSASRGIGYLVELLLNMHAEPDLGKRRKLLRFATRWQQFTAPVTAKSMEDTVFYRYLRLVSLNDVGGDPRRFGMSVEEFHEANEERSRTTPHTLLGTSTHDAKRAEDVRARLDVLSEMPGVWNEALQRWHAMNGAHASHVKTMHSSRAPTLQHEYLLYQTLVGAWPLEPMDTRDSREDFRERIQSYMLKAAREAKDATAWMEPDPDYEQGLARFIDALLEHGSEPAAARSPGFLEDLRTFVDDIAPFGACNSLGMAVLKLTSPGVPDIYQGCETWNLSLVDPDNRRHIDFAALSSRLDAVEAAFGGADALPAEALAELRGSWKDGRLKMLVVSRLLALRRAQAALLRNGRYTRLPAHGPARGHVVAYARELEGLGCCVVIAGRLMRRLTQGDARKLHGGLVWEDTHVVLPQDASMAASWREAITGRIVPAHRAAPGAQASIALSGALSGLTAAVLVPA